MFPGQHSHEEAPLALGIRPADTRSRQKERSMPRGKGGALAQGKSGDLDPMGFNEDGVNNAVSKAPADEDAEPLLSDEHLHTLSSHSV